MTCLCHLALCAGNPSAEAPSSRNQPTVHLMYNVRSMWKCTRQVSANPLRSMTLFQLINKIKIIIISLHCNKIDWLV